MAKKDYAVVVKRTRDIFFATWNDGSKINWRSNPFLDKKGVLKAAKELAKVLDLPVIDQT